MNEPDECEHGASGYCGLCVAVGENKLSQADADEIHRKSKDTGAKFGGDTGEPGYGDWTG